MFVYFLYGKQLLLPTGMICFIEYGVKKNKEEVALSFTGLVSSFQRNPSTSAFHLI